MKSSTKKHIDQIKEQKIACNVILYISACRRLMNSEFTRWCCVGSRVGHTPSVLGIARPPWGIPWGIPRPRWGISRRLGGIARGLRFVTSWIRHRLAWTNNKKHAITHNNNNHEFRVRFGVQRSHRGPKILEDVIGEKFYELRIAQGEGRRSPMTSSDAKTDSKPNITIIIQYRIVYSCHIDTWSTFYGHIFNAQTTVGYTVYLQKWVHALHFSRFFRPQSTRCNPLTWMSISVTFSM